MNVKEKFFNLELKYMAQHDSEGLWKKKKVYFNKQYCKIIGRMRPSSESSIEK